MKVYSFVIRVFVFLIDILNISWVSFANDTTFYLVGLDANLERARGVFNLFYNVCYLLRSIGSLVCCNTGFPKPLFLFMGTRKGSWPRS